MTTTTRKTFDFFALLDMNTVHEMSRLDPRTAGNVPSPTVTLDARKIAFPAFLDYFWQQLLWMELQDVKEYAVW